LDFPNVRKVLKFRPPFNDQNTSQTVSECEIPTNGEDFDFMTKSSQVLDNFNESGSRGREHQSESGPFLTGAHFAFLPLLRGDCASFDTGGWNYGASRFHGSNRSIITAHGRVFEEACGFWD
jgi:hypothetical protein